MVLISCGGAFKVVIFRLFSNMASFDLVFSFHFYIKILEILKFKLERKIPQKN
jgi:hypothetical protein